MKKQELVYREIIYSAMEKKQYSSTQSELSKKLRLSLSIVNSAIKKLDSMGAVKINQRNFNVLDIKKILYFWASIRNLNRDILLKKRIELPVREIERIMPNVIFTAYTAYKLKFGSVPADYSEVYVYASEEESGIIKKRIANYKNSDTNPNFFVLRKDIFLRDYGAIPLAQLFVDLWNLKEWYAKDFINELAKKLGDI